jgi:hypothetical protein
MHMLTAIIALCSSAQGHLKQLHKLAMELPLQLRSV